MRRIQDKNAISLRATPNFNFWQCVETSKVDTRDDTLRPATCVQSAYPEGTTTQQKAQQTVQHMYPRSLLGALHKTVKPELWVVV